MADHLATDPRQAAAGPRARGAEAAAGCVRAGSDRARRPQPVATQRDSRVPDHGNDSSPARDGKQLERTLGVPGLTVHYITSVIGTGVLILPGHAAHSAGPLSLAAWALLVAYSYPFALVFARLSVHHPTSQGISGVVQLAFGSRWSRLTSLYLMLTLVVTNPVLGLAAARYLLSMWYPAPTNLQVGAVGFGFLTLSVLFNLLGLRASARVQAAVLGALIVFLVLVMAVALPQAQTARLRPFAPHGWTALGPALIICFFGFIGWENAAPVAEEVINPRRTFPRAILRGVATVGFLYLSMALTVVLVLPRDTTDSQQITAFSTLLQIASGHGLSQVGDMVAVVLLVLSMNAWVLGTSRVVYSQARTGLLPRRLARVSGRGNAPRAALLALLSWLRGSGRRPDAQRARREHLYHRIVRRVPADLPHQLPSRRETPGRKGHPVVHPPGDRRDTGVPALFRTQHALCRDPRDPRDPRGRIRVLGDVDPSSGEIATRERILDAQRPRGPPA